MNLGYNVKISRLTAAQGDGQGSVNGSELDMSGWDGVMFIAKFDDVDVGAVLTLAAQQDTVTGMAGAATLSGTATYTATATDADDDLLVLDVYRPRERFLRPRTTIGTANAILAGVIAIQYRGIKAPVTQPATVLDIEMLVSPAEA